MLAFFSMADLIKKGTYVPENAVLKLALRSNKWLTDYLVAYFDKNRAKFFINFSFARPLVAWLVQE